MRVQSNHNRRNRSGCHPVGLFAGASRNLYLDRRRWIVVLG